MERLFKKRQVCEIISKSPVTLWRMVKSGEFPKGKRIGIHLMWRESDINQWIQKQFEEKEE